MGKQRPAWRAPGWLPYAGAALVVFLATQSTGPKKTEEAAGDASMYVDAARSALFSRSSGRAEDQHKPSFAESAYWDEFYTKHKTLFDWYDIGWAQLKPLVPIEPHHAVLQIGCGNSRLHAELVADGVTNVTSIDYSEPVITQMKKRYPGLAFSVGDARNLSFASGSFDVVVEKGTLDALAAGAMLDVATTTREVARVLRPGGRFISVTAPSIRGNVDDFPWATSTKTELKDETPGQERMHWVWVKTK